MAHAHSSRTALERSALGITVFGAGMIAADALNRRTLSGAVGRADESVEQRRRQQDRADRQAADCRRTLAAARSRASAAESSLASARASVPVDRRYAGAALARVRSAEIESDAARSAVRTGEADVQAADRSAREAHDALERSRSAARRIRGAAESYRRAAVVYVGASAAIVGRGRAQLGRLGSLLDKYHAIEGYGSPSGSAVSSSASASAAGGGGVSTSASADQEWPWLERWGLQSRALRDIDPVPSGACSSDDRWDIERFENLLVGLLGHEDWDRRIEDSDAEAGRSGERTLRAAVRRLLEDPIIVDDARPARVLRGRGHVAAAQRAGLLSIPVLVEHRSAEVESTEPAPGTRAGPDHE